MLVLTRKPGESVVMKTADGELIKVMLVRSSSGCSRLGVEAPRSVSVDREEIWKRKEAQK